jgi:hypothetical protein
MKHGKTMDSMYKPNLEITQSADRNEEFLLLICEYSAYKDLKFH